MAFRLARNFALTSFMVLALSACSGGGTGDATAEQPVAAKVAAPAGKVWSDVAVRTADGGLLIGNADAPIKIIEFASLTCGACAQFSADSGEELKKEFIDSGRVSFELRHFLRNPIDLLAASIIQCAPVDRQYALSANILATQSELFAGAEAGGQAAQTAMTNEADPARFAKASEALGISAMFQSRGMAAAQVQACLATPTNPEKLVADNNKWNEAFQISGTPTFVINGQVADGVVGWPALRDRLRAMGAR
ncbi:MAG: thioredoxin domain-containing protein [Sphingopyxis sp.]|nr:thioredoxin domain-containing protein [Sphingopyxis sp.]